MSKRITSTGTDDLPRAGFWPESRVGRKIRRDEVEQATEGTDRRTRVRPIDLADPPDAPLPYHLAPTEHYTRPAPPLAEVPVENAIVPDLPGWETVEAPFPRALMRCTG